jgi:hypothetical protein
MTLSAFTVTIMTLDDSPHNTLPLAPLEIRNRLANGTSGALASIFSDAAGTTPITQTGATTDSLGQFLFYASPAPYNAVFDNNGTPVISAIDVGLTTVAFASAIDRLNPDTLAIAIADASLLDGDLLHVEEHSTGTGGGGIWKVILKGTTAGVDLPNTRNIVASTGNVLLALTLVIEGLVNIKQVGVIPSLIDTQFAIKNSQILNGLFSDGFTDFDLGTGFFFLEGGWDVKNTSGIIIRGDGSDAAFFRVINTTDFGIKVGNHNASSNSGGELSGFTIQGSIVSGTDFTDRVYLTDQMISMGGLINGFNMFDVDILDTTTGIDSTGSALNFNRNFNNVRIAGTINGFLSLEANSNNFQGLNINFYQQKGMSIFGFAMNFNSCSFESGASLTDFGLDIQGSNGTTIAGCYFEANHKSLKIGGTVGNRAKGNVVSGNYLTGTDVAGSTAIEVDAADGNVIQGNWLRKHDLGLVWTNSSINCTAGPNHISDASVDYSVDTPGFNIFRPGENLFDISNSAVRFQTRTRTGVEAEILRASFTTINNLLDVTINSHSQEWRVFLGGRSGSDGGTRPTRDGEQWFGSENNRWAEMFATLQTFANEAAAASLSQGQIYKTATGELRIKL